MCLPSLNSYLFIIYLSSSVTFMERSVCLIHETWIFTKAHDGKVIWSWDRHYYVKGDPKIHFPEAKQKTFRKENNKTQKNKEMEQRRG